MRFQRLAALAALGTALLLTACSGGGSDASPGPAAPQSSEAPAGVTEASKGKSCEEYRDLSAQVEAANAEVQAITVSSEEDGQKVSELMTKVSDLTEKADAAYGLCYAEGAEPADDADQ